MWVSPRCVRVLYAQYFLSGILQFVNPCQNPVKHRQGKTPPVLSRGCTIETEVLGSVTKVSGGSNEWKHVAGISKLA